MNRLRRENRESIIKTIVIPLLLTLLLIGLMVLGMYLFTDTAIEQDRLLTESSIRKTVITCYADEGRYPPDISYMEEHYGLKADADRYIIDYDCPAANIFPNINVFTRE